MLLASWDLQACLSIIISRTKITNNSICIDMISWILSLSHRLLLDWEVRAEHSTLWTLSHMVWNRLWIKIISTLEVEVVHVSCWSAESCWLIETLFKQSLFVYIAVSQIIERYSLSVVIFDFIIIHEILILDDRRLSFLYWDNTSLRIFFQCLPGHMWCLVILRILNLAILGSVLLWCLWWQHHLWLLWCNWHLIIIVVENMWSLLDLPGLLWGRHHTVLNLGLHLSSNFINQTIIHVHDLAELVFLDAINVIVLVFVLSTHVNKIWNISSLRGDFHATSWFHAVTVDDLWSDIT